MKRPIRVLELRSVRGTGGGPEKTIILGTRQTNVDEFDITVCYLRDARDPMFAIGDQAQALGGRYCEITERHSFDPAIWRPLRKMVREKRIHIVHSHEYKTDFLAWLLSRDGIRPLATVHGWTGDSARERWIYYPADKRLLARFPRLIAVSNGIRNELMRAGAKSERLKVVLNGIDPDAFRRVAAERERARAAIDIGAGDLVVGSVGRLEPQKRFDVLLRAFARLRATMPERRLKLLIAGEGSQRTALTSAIASLGLGSCCHLLGHQTDIVQLHHVFDVFVQSSDYEGTPNAVLEAMAMETPLAVTDVGGTAELVRNGIDGIVIPPGNLEALSSALALLITEPEQARQRAGAARRRVETDLSFRARMRKVEQVYRDLMLDQRRSA